MKDSPLAMYGTFSKAPRAFGFDEGYKVERGRGSQLELRLPNGSRTWVLDWVCGLGANLLGYADTEFNKQVKQQVDDGAGFSLPHYLEEKVAGKLVDLVGRRIPGWQSEHIQVRLAKSGSDVNSMAIRLARSVTGKKAVLACGYQGWGIEFVAATPPAHGIPEEYQKDIKSFAFNDMTSLEKAAYYYGDNVAAVIIEQGIFDPDPRWYEYLRRFCDDQGALLILDEVVTGLRFGIGGAAERFDIHPDLVTMGKALGNGLAVSALLGRKEYMQWFARTDPVFCSSTHWGEAVSLAAANAVLDIFDKEAVEHVWLVGKLLMDALSMAGWKVLGHPPRSLLIFDNEYQRAFFIDSMMKFQVLMNRPNFVSIAHSLQNVELTSYAAKRTYELMTELSEAKLIEQTADHLPHVLFSNR